MACEPVPSYPGDRLVLVDGESELRDLLHRLNNQLGIILANAELLERHLSDDVSRSRASQITTSVVDAIGTARDIRSRLTVSPD